MNCTKQDIEREFILQNQSLSSNPAKLEEMSSLLTKAYKLDHSWASQLWNEVIDQHTQNKPEHAKYYVGRIAKGISEQLGTNAMFDFLFIDEMRGKKLLQYGPPRGTDKWEIFNYVLYLLEKRNIPDAVRVFLCLEKNRIDHSLAIKMLRKIRESGDPQNADPYSIKLDKLTVTGFLQMCRNCFGIDSDYYYEIYIMTCNLNQDYSDPDRLLSCMKASIYESELRSELWKAFEYFSTSGIFEQFEKLLEIPDNPPEYKENVLISELTQFRINNGYSDSSKSKYYNLYAKIEQNPTVLKNIFSRKYQQYYPFPAGSVLQYWYLTNNWAALKEYLRLGLLASDEATAMCYLETITGLQNTDIKPEYLFILAELTSDVTTSLIFSDFKKTVMGIISAQGKNPVLLRMVGLNPEQANLSTFERLEKLCADWIAKEYHGEEFSDFYKQFRFSVERLKNQENIPGKNIPQMIIESPAILEFCFTRIDFDWLHIKSEILYISLVKGVPKISLMNNYIRQTMQYSERSKKWHSHTVDLVTSMLRILREQKTKAKQMAADAAKTPVTFGGKHTITMDFIPSNSESYSLLYPTEETSANALEFAENILASINLDYYDDIVQSIILVNPTDKRIYNFEARLIEEVNQYFLLLSSPENICKAERKAKSIRNEIEFMRDAGRMNTIKSVYSKLIKSSPIPNDWPVEKWLEPLRSNLSSEALRYIIEEMPDVFRRLIQTTSDQYVIERYVDKLTDMGDFLLYRKLRSIVESEIGHADCVSYGYSHKNEKRQELIIWDNDHLKLAFVYSEPIHYSYEQYKFCGFNIAIHVQKDNACDAQISLTQMVINGQPCSIAEEPDEPEEPDDIIRSDAKKMLLWAVKTAFRDDHHFRTSREPDDVIWLYRVDADKLHQVGILDTKIHSIGFSVRIRFNNETPPRKLQLPYQEFVLTDECLDTWAVSTDA